MAIERMHDDIDSNRRQRLLKKGSLEDRVELLERLISKLLSASKREGLSKKDKDDLARIESADKANPEKDDD